MWDANGSVGPVDIAKKRPSDCYMVLEIRGGKFVRVKPTDKAFQCDPGGYKYV